MKLRLLVLVTILVSSNIAADFEAEILNFAADGTL